MWKPVLSAANQVRRLVIPPKARTAMCPSGSVSQLVLFVPLAIQRSLDHKLCLDVSTSTQSHDPIGCLQITQISVRPRFGSTRHYSVAWQTASTLLPSGSRTKVP